MLKDALSLTNNLEDPQPLQENKPIQINRRKTTKNIVATIAFLMGIQANRLDYLYSDDCYDLLVDLNADNAAKTIRILSQIRTVMLREYVIFENNLNRLVNIDNMPSLIDNNDIKWLRANGIEVLKTNTPLDSYIISINKLILDNIDRCKSLIPSWIRWDLVRDLFLMPNCYAGVPKNTKNDPLSKAKKHYWENATNYGSSVECVGNKK